MSVDFNSQQPLSYAERQFLEQICIAYYERKFGGTCKDLQSVKFVRVRGPHLIFRSAADKVLRLEWTHYLAAKQNLEFVKN